MKPITKQKIDIPISILKWKFLIILVPDEREIPWEDQGVSRGWVSPTGGRRGRQEGMERGLQPAPEDERP
jgi:hypothetical protein